LELTGATGAELDPVDFEASCIIDDDTAIISDIRALDGVKSPDRIVTNTTLKLIQGDVVTFRAEPPAGGWLNDDDVIWTVTGQPDLYYSVVNTVTFDTFYDEISVCAYTPGAATVACLDVERAAHPTGIENTRHVPYVNPIGGPYNQGRDYIHDLVPSEGATGQDLFDAYQAGKLELKEYGVVVTDSIGNLPPGEPPPGTGQSTFEIVLKGTTASPGNDMVAALLTQLDVNRFTNGNTVFPTLPRQTTFAQDFLWKGSAARAYAPILAL
jgi:hypothetical protein